MSLMDKMWDAITNVIKMNDKVERLGASVKEQQFKIEDMTARIIRLETALELALVGKSPSSRQIDHKK